MKKSKQLDVGNNIKVIRVIRNINQSTMAKKLKIVQSTYSKFENGRLEISPTNFKKIANILEVSEKFILAFDPDKLLPGKK